MTKKPKARKKQKMSNAPPFLLPSSPALPPLPNEVVVSILARISKSYYSSLCLVSKNFFSLLSSPEIYTARSEIGTTEPRLYMYLRLPKPHKNRLFTLFEPVRGEFDLAPVRLSSSYSPGRLNSTSVTVGYEIYQIGGGKHSKAVRVLDCRSHTWRRAPRLTVGRNNAKSCFVDGRIYVIGGGREDESMAWGEVFDIKTQIWKPLPSPDDDNNIDLMNPQVVVLEGRVNVITKKSKYVYDTEQERWIRDVLFLDIKSRIGHFCVIDDVMFAEIGGQFKWYNSGNGEWLVVANLNRQYLISEFDGVAYDTIQLVNHGGKLVIIWQDWCKTFWCAMMIRLEKHLRPWGTEFRGEVEDYDDLCIYPSSHKLLSCLSVSL